MRILTYFFICFFSVNAFSQNVSRERIPLKKTATNPFGIAEETEYMPGNDGFGFFIKELTADTAKCRFRAKVYCDYGLGSTKVIKHKEVLLDFTDVRVTNNTNEDGVFDILYRCNPGFTKRSVSIKIGGYQKVVEVSKFPKSIELSSNDCKLIK